MYFLPPPEHYTRETLLRLSFFDVEKETANTFLASTPPLFPPSLLFLQLPLELSDTHRHHIVHGTSESAGDRLLCQNVLNFKCVFGRPNDENDTRASKGCVLVVSPLTCLSSQLGPEELAHLSRVTLQCERKVHDVEDDRLDAVAPPFNFSDHAGHLVPACACVDVSSRRDINIHSKRSFQL